MKISRSTALEIFGLRENFSDLDLKKEYRRLVKIVHPDTGGDENLFKFIDLCKNVLVNGDNENIYETKEHKSSPNKNNAKPKKEDANITLEVLNEAYPDYIDLYEDNYNIKNIKTSVLIYIQPRFRKNLEKCIVVNAQIPYSEFNKDLNLVKFNITVKIPTEMHKFRKFKVRLKFFNDTFMFNVSDGDFKVIEHAQYKYTKCLNSVYELHFEK